MKKVLIITGALLLAGLLAIVVPLNSRFVLIQYQKTLEMDALVAGEEDGWLRAQHGEITTLVRGGNLSRITRLLTPGEVQRLFFAPALQDAIVLNYSNGDCVRVAADAGAEDRALVQLVSGSGTVNVAIEGYGVVDGIAQAVSAEGFSEANEVVEGESE